MTTGGELAKNLIEERWLAANEVPLAYGHPENLITPYLEQQWLSDVTRFSRIFPTDLSIREFMTSGQLDQTMLQRRYRNELRFLSRSDILEGLGDFAGEIQNNFSPTDSLFYLPAESYSSNLIYLTLLALDPGLAQFGTVKDSMRGFELGKRNGYQMSEVSEAKSYFYVEDWILSGEHLQSFLTKDVAGRLHTFHLVASSTGFKYLQSSLDYLNPRFKYRIDLARSPGLFDEVPVYGYHKIPDRLPGYYAPRQDDLYSIFGKDAEGWYLPINARLADHSLPLL